MLASNTRWVDEAPYVPGIRQFSYKKAMITDEDILVRMRRIKLEQITMPRALPLIIPQHAPIPHALRTKCVSVARHEHSIALVRIPHRESFRKKETSGR